MIFPILSISLPNPAVLLRAIQLVGSCLYVISLRRWGFEINAAMPNQRHEARKRTRVVLSIQVSNFVSNPTRWWNIYTIIHR